MSVLLCPIVYTSLSRFKSVTSSPSPLPSTKTTRTWSKLLCPCGYSQKLNIANDDDEDQVIFCIIELCNLFSQSENETNRLSVLWGTNGRVTRLATYLSIGQQQQFFTIILISCVPGIVISRTCQFVCLCAMELHQSTGVE